MVAQAVHVATSIDRPAGEVYDYISDPTNLSAWAAGLAHQDVEQVDGTWVVESPLGRVEIAFAPRNTFGIADHDVTLPDGSTVNNPLRVIPNGTGCDVVFSVRRQPTMTDGEFAADVAAVEADLERLRTLFTGAPSPQRSSSISIINVMAQLIVTDLGQSVTFYTSLLGRGPDANPMDKLFEWNMPGAGSLQVYEEPDRAGRSGATLHVADLDAAAAQLDAIGIDHEPLVEATFVRVVQLADPDGNRIVLTGDKS